jgi:hypothetical protein
LGKGLKMSIQLKDDNGQIMPVVKFAASQGVSYDASVQSTAVSANATVIRVVATTDCHIQIGVNPTATTSSAFLPAGVVEYIGIKPGDKVAAIKRSGGSAGQLFVTECA